MNEKSCVSVSVCLWFCCMILCLLCYLFVRECIRNVILTLMRASSRDVELTLMHALDDNGLRRFITL
uniref:Uncharacterized protein n=1 Tax=Rhizophora mucronata TaxID=61149 RepID=A0A2P2PWG5_RHIMU